jgi:hypothetical protein
MHSSYVEVIRAISEIYEKSLSVYFVSRFQITQTPTALVVQVVTQRTSEE